MDSETLQPDSTGPARRGAAWNSLEVAKLLMSAATPVALFAMGIWVTDRATDREETRNERALEAAHKRDDTIRNEATVRATQWKKEADKRDAEIRREAAVREAAVREEAVRRDAAIRREGFARDAALRREANARDDAVRRETLELARYGKLIDKRVELWDKVGPKLAYLRTQVIATRTGMKFDYDQVLVVQREVIDLLLASKGYLSDEFNEASNQFLRAFGDFMIRRVQITFASERRLSDREIAERLRDETGRVDQTYVALREAAADEIVILRRPLPER